MGIVVGVDGSAASVVALRWAVVEAALRQTEVTACHAWHAPFAGGGGAPPDDLSLETAGRRALDSVVAEVEAAALPKPVERLLVRGVPASALLDLARKADLLVVGARDGALGSVSRQVLAHAPCPVVVVPA